MSDCLFCKIVSGEVPSTKIYEDDKIYAFPDINPAAKTHILIIPKEHIADADAINDSNIDIISHVFLTIPMIAKNAGLTDGYRIVSNVGEHGQQSIQHLHFHIIGGQQLKWELV